VNIFDVLIAGRPAQPGFRRRTDGTHMSIAFRKALRLSAATFTALCATARWTHRDGQDLSQRTVARILEQPDQYRATMTIATTMNAATSERTRSSVFDLGFGAASGGGIAYVGGCSSPANQPTASDFMGSNAITICSTWPHLEQSNVRSSNPVGPGELRTSIMRARHFGQRSR
jgi:hypothetical protein